MWKSLKRWPVLLALLVAFGALAVVLVCFPYGTRVTLGNCERIHEGMTYAEVCAILGEPWNDRLLEPEKASDIVYQSNGYLWAVLMRGMRDQGAKPPDYSHLWVGGSLAMFVVFDDNNRVMLARVQSDPNPRRSWLPARVWRRLRERFGW